MPNAVRPGIRRIGDAIDYTNNAGSGTDGYPLTYDHDTGTYTLVDIVGAHIAAGDPHTQYLLASGSRVGASSGLQAFTSGIVTGIIRPASDSTTAVRVQNAAGSTSPLIIDTTNGRVGVGGTPVVTFQVIGSTSTYIMRVGDGTQNAGLYASSGFCAWGTISSTDWRFFVDNNSARGITVKSSTGFFGVGTVAPAAMAQIVLDNATTAAIDNVAIITHNSTGTPAAGFGAALCVQLESSTTAGQDAGRIQVLWNVATHASRAADMVSKVYYTSTEQEFMRGRGASGGAQLGFLGATPVARPSAYTLAATATRTMPTPESAFTGQDNAQAGSVYAKSADIITLQTRVDSIEGVLRQLIIDLAATSGFGLLAAS